jgi:hypothetical protein
VALSTISRNRPRAQDDTRAMTSPIGMRDRCDRSTTSCAEIESKNEQLTPDPRSAEPRAIPAHYGVGASVVAAQTRASVPPPLSAAECGRMTDVMLDQQASALRSRLERSASYPERANDLADLKTVESELVVRESAKQHAAQVAHGGVKLCKRVADLPGKEIHGAEHWWLQTSRREAGMGPTTGNVPGHGESLPETRATQLVDHSREAKTDCHPVDKVVDEDCVDRELQVGAATGDWTPGLNDCHTVVKRIVDKCHDEAVSKALAADTERKLKEADAGAP